MIKIKSLLSTILLIGSSVAWGESKIDKQFTCKLIMQKNSCWHDFEVWSTVIEKFSEVKKADIYLKPGKEPASVEFKCNPEQSYYLSSKFKPLIWNDDKDKVFYSSKIFVVPKSLPTTEEKWQIHACFPDTFSHVPMPLHGMLNCTCDLDKSTDKSNVTKENNLNT